MTVARAPGSIEAAVLAALHGLSDAEVEAWTGRSKSYWYKVSNPAKSERLDLADAAQLDAASIARGDPARFRQLLAELTAAALRRQGAEGRPASLDDGLRHVVVECGQLAAALAHAAADGRLTPGERRRIAAEAQDVIEAAAMIRDAALAEVRT